MRDYIALEITLYKPEGEYNLTLSKNHLSYKGDESFEVEGEFPFWKCGAYMASYNEKICLNKQDSKVSFQIISVFDNGDRVPLKGKGTLYQNDLVFMLSFLRDELLCQGKDLPFVFLEEYYPGERHRYPHPDPAFLVSDEKIDGHTYHIEGDMFSKKATRIWDENDEILQGEAFDRVFDIVATKAKADLGKKVQGCQIDIKLNKKIVHVNKDNIDRLFPQIQEEYGLPDVIFGYREVGEGYHASARIDGYKGTWYQNCTLDVNLEDTYKAMFTQVLSVMMKRRKSPRLKKLEEESFHFLPAEYVGARSPIKEIFATYEKVLDTKDCLAFVESIDRIEKQLEDQGYPWDLLFRVRDYLLRLERIGFMEALTLKKPA